MNKKVIGVCLEPELAEYIEKNAEINERTISAECRFLIKKQLFNSGVIQSLSTLPNMNEKADIPEPVLSE